MIKNLTITVTAMLTLAACATHSKTMPLEDLSMLENTPAKIMSIQEDAVTFIPIESRYKPVGHRSLLHVGERFIRNQNIANPAEHIEEQIIKSLAQQYKLEINDDNLDYRGKKKPKALLEKFNTLVVDASTVRWGYGYFPDDSRRYGVYYNAVIQLVDGNAGTLIASHDCIIASHKNRYGAPTLNELKADDSALIKSTLIDLADKCVSEFKREVFSFE